MHQLRRLGVAALCALVGTLFVFVSPATADSAARRASGGASRARSIAHCVSFDQREKDETAVEMTVKSTCTMPVDCKVSWQLVCAPESKKRRKVTPGTAAFTLSTDASQTTGASAADCGDDSWIIKNVTWRCEPNKE